MKTTKLQTPPTEVELAQALYGLQATGYDMVLRRLAFQRDMLTTENVRLAQVADNRLARIRLLHDATILLRNAVYCPVGQWQREAYEKATALITEAAELSKVES